MSRKIVATVDDLTFEFRKESIILMECKGPSVYAIEREPRKIYEIAGRLPMASTRINLR